MTAAALEAQRTLRDIGDTDAVTYSWGDVESGVFGLVRLAAGIGGDGAASSSVLAVAFAGRDSLGAIAESGAALPVVAVTDAPLERWTVTSTATPAFALTFEALSPPAEYGGRAALVKAGGMEGYEQLCSVRGVVEGREVDGLGQRGHSWGNPDWDRIALTRSVGIWLGEGEGTAIGTVRSVKATNHAEEAVWGALFDGSRALSIEEPRLSTTTDADGRQLRAGVELWVEESDDYPLRGVGEMVTGSTLDLGALRLDVAFFVWHIEGRTAIGRYDIIRRA